MAPPKLWVWFLCVGCLVYRCHGNVPTPVDPILVIEGDPYVLVLFDFHTHVDPGGSCTDLYPRTLEMLWSLRWIHGVQRSNPPNSVGLLVYDICRSKARAIQVVSRYLNTGMCVSNVTNVAGVISYTSKDVREIISDLVGPFGILHATISDDRHISVGYGTLLDMSTFSPWKIQAITVVLDSARWTRVASLSVNTSSARAEQRLFHRMAVDQQFCITDSHIYSNASTIDTLGSKVVVFFMAGTHDIDDIISEIGTREDHVFVVVGDVNILRISENTRKNVVFLSEILPSKVYVLAYLMNMLNSVDTEADTITKQYLLSLPFCSRNSSTNATMCSSAAVDYFSPRMNGRDMMAVFTSFYNIERLILTAEAYNCTNYNFDKCTMFVPYVALSIDQPSSGFPFNLYELTEGWLVDEPTDVVVTSVPVDKMLEIARLFRDEFLWSSAPIWLDFMKKLNESSCRNGECISCDQCAHSLHDSNPVAFLDGELYVSGLFPIHKSSQNGDPCGVISWEATQLAEAFLYAVDTVKARHGTKNLLPNVNVGALVLDSCGKSGHIANVIERDFGCPAVFQIDDQTSHVEPNHILSFVEFNPLPHIAKSDLTTDKTLLHLSKEGVGVNDFSFVDFLPETLSILTSVNWTYISVVISKLVYEDTSVRTALDTFRQHGVCISQTIQFDSLKTDLSGIFGPTRNADAVLLLTLPEDSVKVIEMAKNTYSMNILLASWSVPDMTGLEVPGMVIVKPKTENDARFYTHMRNIDTITHTRNPWLRDFHEQHQKCHYQTSSDILYPEQCSDNATVDGMDNSTLVTRMVNTVDLIVTAIDQLYKELCPLQNGICPEWLKEPDIHTRIRSLILSADVNDRTYEYGFSDKGKLQIPYDILNVRLQDSSTPEPVRIGGFLDGVMTIDDNSVMTYDQTGIPLVTPHHCSHWCPECNGCPSPVTVTSRDHNYRPGDLVLGSVFPIHGRGASPFTCGDLTIAMETEELVDAFLFAVTTAKTRYPYLFPNVTLGSLVIDSCSDDGEILKTLMNFETCSSTFATFNSPATSPSPAQVSSYILYGDNDVIVPAKALVQRLGKLSISLGDEQSVMNDPLAKQVLMLDPSQTVHAVLELLRRMDWSYVSIVSSSSDLYRAAVGTFLTQASAYNICVAFNHSIETGDVSSTLLAVELISKIPANTVIILATEKDIRYFLSEHASIIVSKNIIIGDIEQDWDTVKDISLPLGTIGIDKAGKVNEDFFHYFADPVHGLDSTLGNPWFTEFVDKRRRCRNTGISDCKSSTNVLMEASKVVLGMDVLLHVLHDRYVRLCPGGEGLCAEMHTSHPIQVDNISFSYQGNYVINIPSAGSDVGTYIIKSFQPSGFEQIGVWSAGRLDIATDKIKAYDSNGMAYGSVRGSRCYHSCTCVNSRTYNLTDDAEDTPDPYSHMLFYDTSAEFDNHLWAVVVLIVSLGGAFVVLMFMLYVAYKVCAGVLYKRYIGLGLTMLMAVIFLYLAVLPFVFTPSDKVCACRRFIPGLAYAFLFATVLAKLMALRAYMLIGLGGELSNVNQVFTIMFITGVQVSIGTQWLVYENAYVLVRTNENVVQYACVFDKVDFVKYLSYAMFIIVLSAMYAVIVRNEKKNLGEARLILAACWITIALWIAWLVVIYIEPRDYIEPTICVGMIACATLILMVVFVPKLYRITNLKYDIRDAGMENGGLGKIDAEFIFERPFTLPAASTLEATFKYSDKTYQTYPKSISTFDSSMSY